MIQLHIHAIDSRFTLGSSPICIFLQISSVGHSLLDIGIHVIRHLLGMVCGVWSVKHRLAKIRLGTDGSLMYYYISQQPVVNSISLHLFVIIYARICIYTYMHIVALTYSTVHHMVIFHITYMSDIDHATNSRTSYELRWLFRKIVDRILFTNGCKLFGTILAHIFGFKSPAWI